MNGTKLMCGYLSNLVFSALLAISPGFVLAAETRDGLQEKGATIETSKCVFSLSVDNTSEGKYFLFNKYFDTTVRMNDIRKASRQCCMSTVNTSSITAAITMMLFRIERFIANDTCRTFVGGKTVQHLQGWRLLGAIFQQLRHECNDPQSHMLRCLAA